MNRQVKQLQHHKKSKKATTKKPYNINLCTCVQCEICVLCIVQWNMCIKNSTTKEKRLQLHNLCMRSLLSVQYEKCIVHFQWNIWIKNSQREKPNESLTSDLMSSVGYCRVAKCHRYGRYICVKILESWGKHRHRRNVTSHHSF